MPGEAQAKPSVAPDERCGCAVGCAPDDSGWSIFDFDLRSMLMFGATPVLYSSEGK